MFQCTPDNIIANPAKGSSKKAFAMDGGLMDRMRPDKTSLDGEGIDRISNHFIGWASCAILKQVWGIDRACTIPAEDAIAPGWKLAYADFDEADENADGEIDEDEQIARDKKLHVKFRRVIVINPTTSASFDLSDTTSELDSD